MPTVTYKCPNCDGGLIFDPATQKFCCEYCQSLFTQQELDQMDLDANSASDQVKQEESPSAAEAPREEEEFTAHAVSYVCPSCGAEVMADDTTAATFCYYCHNPVVLSGRLSGALKPDRVIPFALKKGDVEQQFLNWCKKKRFMKKDFFSQSQLEKLTGVYFPFWLLNCTVDGSMNALGRKIRTWRQGNTEYTETEEYELVREADIDFRDMPFAALKRQEMELTKGIYPYDFAKAVRFNMAYLSGFQAEKRGLERKDVSPEAAAEIRKYSEMLLRDTTTHYSGVTVNQMRASMLKEKWEYTLLPVWVLTYQYRDKTYYYAMNGQNGKVCGEVPLSLGRLAILFGVVAAVLFVILLLGGWLL